MLPPPVPLAHLGGFGCLMPGQLSIRASGIQRGSPGILVQGAGLATPLPPLNPAPASGCLSAPLVRQFSGTANSAGELFVGPSELPVFAPGSTQHFQVWYREGLETRWTNTLSFLIEP